MIQNLLIYYSKPRYTRKKKAKIYLALCSSELELRTNFRMLNADC